LSKLELGWANVTSNDGLSRRTGVRSDSGSKGKKLGEVGLKTHDNVTKNTRSRIPECHLER